MENGWTVYRRDVNIWVCHDSVPIGSKVDPQFKQFSAVERLTVEYEKC